MKNEFSFAEGRSNAREKREAVAAFDAMVASRPLKPPPLRREPGALRTAGQLALAREVRAGIVVPPTRWAP